MKKVKAPPGAKRLIEGLRDMGYESSTAIADLIDNSLAAHASEVYIQIEAQVASRPPYVLIADNGRGMEREHLQEAMRFGAYQEYSADDLGKYGLGLKTASLSQCRRLTVASKARATRGSRPRRCYARWDLDEVHQTDDWDLLLPAADELETWEVEALNHAITGDSGTAVLWTGLDEALPLLSEHDPRRREKYLGSLIDSVSSHLRMVFHRFMEGSVTGRRRLHLYVCGEELKPWDPFCRQESTKELDVLTLPVSVQGKNGGITETVSISPYVLPREDEFSSAESRRDAAGPKAWNQQQGFYFYRNHRLLRAGGWNWLRSADEHTKLLRVAVDFPRGLDRAFSVNIMKMRARLPDDIRERVGAAVSKWAKTAKDRYAKPPKERTASRNAPNTQAPPPPTITKKQDAPSVVTVGQISFSISNAPRHSLTVTEGRTPEQVRVIVPHNHPFAAIFDETANGDDLRRLCIAALSILEAVYEGKMRPNRIPIESLKRLLRRYL